MSKYTTEVRYICEHYAGYDESKDFTSVAEIIEKASLILVIKFRLVQKTRFHK